MWMRASQWLRGHAMPPLSYLRRLTALTGHCSSVAEAAVPSPGHAEQRRCAGVSGPDPESTHQVSVVSPDQRVSVGWAVLSEPTSRCRCECKSRDHESRPARQIHPGQHEEVVAGCSLRRA